ncbi:Glucoside xylosyltransferase 2 [Holothuria leucospilota]|uniref:UDP-D-xylose:beta-D-glucoside alpha-1,3-D-xylosyltransferase n=1 Tax=Holothuria leucospilota TaxID=206669 RepID=A0A9Q1HM41_HOLLE|nr:Glucoside xylosyltransferase 2 [Holothuria leucospilota]
MRQKVKQALYWISLVCCGLIVGYYIGSARFKETVQLEWEPKRHSGAISCTASWASRMNATEQQDQMSNSSVEHSSLKTESRVSTENPGNDVGNKTLETNQTEKPHGNFTQHETLTQNKTNDELQSIQAQETPRMLNFFVNGRKRFDFFPEPQPLETVQVEPVVDLLGKKQLPFRECIHLSVVACGGRIATADTLVTLKSAAILSHTCLVFHVFAEDNSQKSIKNELNNWPNKTRDRITFYIYPITYPSSEDQSEWKGILKPCSTQRIFIPELLPMVDTVLYVETDTLFINRIEDIWQYLTRFNSTQFAGMSPAHENPADGWYNRNARQPYYGKLGLDSGVMLLNLTRMREFKWSKRLVPIYRQYKDKIVRGNQDLINVALYFHSDTVFEIPCEWNYRFDHCDRGNTCLRMETEGIALLRGTKGKIHADGPFRAVHETYRDYQFGCSILEGLVQPLKERFKTMRLHTSCVKPIRESVLAILTKYT